MTHLAKAREVFDIEIAALRKVRTLLDKSFDAAVELIAAALARRGKIVVVGIGKSGNVGAKIAATLTSTGSTSVVLNSVDALHGDVGIVNDGDVILAIDGREPTSAQHAGRILRSYGESEKLTLRVQRDRKVQDIEITMPGPSGEGRGGPGAPRR